MGKIKLESQTLRSLGDERFSTLATIMQRNRLMEMSRSPVVMAQYLVSGFKRLAWQVEPIEGKEKSLEDEAGF